MTWSKFPLLTDVDSKTHRDGREELKSAVTVLQRSAARVAASSHGDDSVGKHQFCRPSGSARRPSLNLNLGLSDAKVQIADLVRDEQHSLDNGR